MFYFNFSDFLLKRVKYFFLYVVNFLNKRYSQLIFSLYFLVASFQPFSFFLVCRRGWSPSGKCSPACQSCDREIDHFSYSAFIYRPRLQSIWLVSEESDFRFKVARTGNRTRDTSSWPRFSRAPYPLDQLSSPGILATFILGKSGTWDIAIVLVNFSDIISKNNVISSRFQYNKFSQEIWCQQWKKSRHFVSIRWEGRVE